MRILQVTNKIPFNAKDGGALAMYQLYNGLSAFGKIDLLAMNTLKHKIDTDSIPEKSLNGGLFSSILTDTTIKPVHLLLNLLFSTQPYILKRFVNRVFREKLAQMLRNSHYDLVQLEGLYLCPYISTIKKHSRAKIVYRPHNIESQIWENNQSFETHWLKRLYLKNMAKRLLRYERKTINQYDLLVPISGQDLQFFLENGNVRPYWVAPFAIDLGQYPCVDENGTQGHFFYIGSLDWIPNVEGLKWFISKVWHVLKSRNPTLVFKVAGRNASEGLVRFFQEHKVNFLGEIVDSRPLFLNNQVMVVPLFAGSGMRVKIIEGMAYGKTIVTTSKGAEGIDCQHGQNIILANNAAEFIGHLSGLFQNYNKMKEIGGNAREMVREKYNIGTVAEQLAAFYQLNLS
jgi:polysaccharide biosynthesis protein PslH